MRPPTLMEAIDFLEDGLFYCSKCGRPIELTMRIWWEAGTFNMVCSYKDERNAVGSGPFSVDLFNLHEPDWPPTPR